MLQINNLTKLRLDNKLFTGIAKKVLLSENKRTETLSLAFIPKEEIQKLNKKYRGENKPTDILSFEGINEIVICPEVVKKNAKRYGGSFKQEMIKVFVHGILHLLGYDHEKSEREAEKMKQKEKKYIK